jgi:hypothetical protein
MSTQGIPAEAADLERALGVAEYRKTAPVDAVQFRADPPGNGLDLARWCRGQYLFAVGTAPALLTVPTLEGYEATARDGDWVCRGGTGEFWVVEQDRFAATHVPAGEVREHVEYAVGGPGQGPGVQPGWPVTREHFGRLIASALAESGVTLVSREDLVTVLAVADAFTEAEPALSAFKRLSAAAGVE